MTARVMLMALLASLGAHMPPWVGLGALADYFHHVEEKREKSKPVEVSFDLPSPAQVTPLSQPRPSPF